MRKKNAGHTNTPKFTLRLRLLIGSLLSAVVILGLSPLAVAKIAPETSPATGLTGTPGKANQAATINFKELAAQASLDNTAPEKVETPFMTGPQNLIPNGPTGTPFVSNPAVPIGNLPNAESPDAAVSFQALPDSNISIPPDTHGAVGPNHVMTVLNTQVRIQDRTGGIVSTVTLNQFWASVNGGSGAFDPKILYDPYNNRWIFTACDNSRSTTSAVLIGVSLTSDPTGGWRLFTVDADAADAVWADFPSIGFNKDWIVVQLNMFNVSDNASNRSHIYVFNKMDMYNNPSTTAPFTLFSRNFNDLGFTSAPSITYDPNLSTIYLASTYNGNFQGAGYIKIGSITGSVGAEVLNVGGFAVINTPWGFTGASGADFAPQLGSAQKIQTNDDRLGNLVYRNGSLWLAHTAFLPAAGITRSSIQWVQINPANLASPTVQQLGRIDDATGVNFYAFPSIAVNKDNDVLLGFSRFSANQYGSANYAFRANADSPGTFRVDKVLKAGEAPYYKVFSGTRNRWGDYSSTQVDPVNDTDFWTVQEYAATPPGDGFDRWGTWWGKIVPPGLPIPASIIATGGNNQSTVVNTNFATSLQATVKDAANNPVAGATVTFTAPANGPSATFPGGNTATTDANGVVTVTAKANTIAGSYSVTATVPGVATPASFTLTNTVGAPTSITPTGGNNQSTVVDTNFANPLAVTIRDSFNNPIAGATVTFAAPANGPSATFPGGNTATTDVNGVATTTVKANTIVGSYTVTATVPGVATPASFTLTNTAGAPTSIIATGGNNQSAAVNTNFANPLAVVVKDAANNPVAGATVTFTAPANGPSATFPGGNTATTDANGVVTVTAKANTIVGSYTVTATVAGVATPASFTLTNTVGAPTSITPTGGNNQSTVVDTNFANPLAVTIRDSFNNPIAGATVTFAAPANGPSATFPGGNTATTDVNGVATTTVKANTIVGSYTVTATVPGVATPASFTLTNTVGAAAILTIVGGDNQSAQINTAFGSSLQVKVTDVVNNPVSGVVVTFTGPANGPGVIFPNGNTATTNASGVATITVAANAITGTYQVTAVATGVANPVSFTLTNAATTCNALLVTATIDDGSGTQCGTLSYALVQPLSGPSQTISFALTTGNTITFTGALTAEVKAGVTLDAGQCGTATPITIVGNIAGNGLRLDGNNTLRNLIIKGFSSVPLRTLGTGNKIYCTRISRN